MSHRTVSAYAGLAAAVLLPAGAAPASAAKKITCSSGTTVLASKDARVFTVTRGQVRRLLACKTGGRKVRRIGLMGRNVPASEFGIERKTLRLTGRYLAYGARACSQEEFCESQVDVVSIRTGKTVLASIATPGAPGDDDFVTDVVLSDRGHVAWISHATVVNDATPIARYVTAKARRTDAGLAPAQLPVTLGTGLDIASTSLALGGGHVYWTQAATARSALLP